MTISDDKSVSRKHATITFPAPSMPLLTDGGSKFGSFINGDQLNGSATLKSGDKIKFGGATSEFILESKDFSVFVKTRRSDCLSKLRELGSEFGFEVRVKGVKEAAYFILDCEDIDAELIEALLLAKYIVSPSYFFQLNQHQLGSDGNCFSLALMQPIISSKTFPMDCWIPQKSRLATFKTVFEGIKRFVLLEEDNEQLVKVIAGLLGIEVKITSEPSNLKFNELLLIRDANRSVSELIGNPTRILDYESVIEALLRNDGQLIEIQTVYPESRVVEPETLKAVPVNTVKSNEINTGDCVPIITSPSPSIDQVYTGRSLTAVIPIPSNLLRPATELSTPAVPPYSIAKAPKFIKCHPKHRQPGTIPALIGPDQLASSTRRPAPLPQSPQSTMKRRVLVKDSWLAEDDFNESEIRQGTMGGRKLPAKENRGLFNLTSSKPLISSYTSNSTDNIQITGTINTHSHITGTNTMINPSPATTATATEPETNPPPPLISTGASSKFQSAFFKNLSINKL